MQSLFVNLKRFDVPTSLGGICPSEDPVEWAAWVIDEAVRQGLGRISDVRIALFFPEALLPTAAARIATHGPESVGRIAIGSQGVFRADVTVGGNFGAFTTKLPAAAASNMGCTWAMIGHSEERKDTFEIIAAYDPTVVSDPRTMGIATRALDTILNQEIVCAFDRGMNVLYCVGETVEERGDGTFEDQQPRVRRTLEAQLEVGLAGVGAHREDGCELVVAYEPRWAIGPGKTPPGPGYIAFVTEYLKKKASAILGAPPAVLYGGGLKRENAASIAGVSTVDGGLVALTRFTPPVAFDPAEFKVIIETYMSGRGQKSGERTI